MDAIELFTPISPPSFQASLTKMESGLSLDNFEAEAARIEEQIEAIKTEAALFRTEVAKRRLALIRVLGLVPSNKLASGRLCAAAQKMVDSVAPIPQTYFEADLWRSVWSAIRPEGNTAYVSSKGGILREVSNLKQAKVQEDRASMRASLARKFLLTEASTNPASSLCEEARAALILGGEKEIVRLAEEALRLQAMKSQYPDGDVMNIDCCGECSTWTLGERRCSCGNVRISLESSGSFLDGTGYFYPYRY